jgi:hypothetical protein
MHIEDKPADGHCRARAIIDQIVPIGIPELGRVLTECTQQILRVACGQPSPVQNCAQRNSFRFVVVISEQAGLKTIEPRDFFGAFKLGMIGNIVRNADELIEREDDGAVLRFDQPGRDWEILVV